MESKDKATMAYAEFLRAIGLNEKNSGIDIEDSARNTAELMHWWMQGIEMDRPDMSLMPSAGSEIISLHDLPFYSFCGHHFVPFFGTVDIDYIPTEHIAGLGSFCRIIDFYARRPQFQEQLCAQIAEHLFKELHPRSVRVRIHARQMCLELHGKGAGIQIHTEKTLGEPF